MTDLICLADTVMKTDLNLSGFKKKFVQHLFAEPCTPYRGVVRVECLTRKRFPSVVCNFSLVNALMLLCSVKKSCLEVFII